MLAAGLDIVVLPYFESGLPTAVWLRRVIPDVHRQPQPLEPAAPASVDGMLTSAVAMVTRQPVMPQEKPSASSLVSIAIWPSGDIKPILTADPPRGGQVVVVTFEEFERSAVRLKNDVLSGKLVLKGEDEIPRLIYDNLVKGKSER